MHSVTEVPGASVTPPSSTGSVVMRLPSWFELSKRRNSSTAVLIRSGSCDQPLLLRRDIATAPPAPLPIRLVVVSCPALSRKMQLCSSSFSRQPLAIVFSLDQPGQHVAVGVAGLCPAPLHQDLEIGEKILHRAVAAGEGLRRDHRLQRAQDRQRPVAQRPALVARHAEQVADHLDRNRGREILDQIDIAPGGESVEQAVDQRHQIGFHLGDRARRQRAHDQPAHPRVRRRVVEHEAGGVVLVEQRGAVFRRELLLLVGGEHLGVLVDGDEVVIARQEPGAVGHAA